MAWFLDAGRSGGHPTRAHGLRAHLWPQPWDGHARRLPIDPIPVARRSYGARVHHPVVLPLHAARREPKIAGAALSMSPFIVLFVVFFWSFLWGIAGAFIGLPIMIAILTICEQHKSTEWIALLLSGH